MTIRMLFTFAILLANFGVTHSQSTADETHSIYFQSGSAALSESTQIELFRLRKELAQNTSLYHLEIHAHTDNIGSGEDNRNLSERRAKAVAGYLIGKGLEATSIKKFTYGESAPKSGNNSVLGRQENRRVDVLVFYEKQVQTMRDYSYKEKSNSKTEQLSAEWASKSKLIQEIATDNLDASAQLYDIDPKSDTLLVGKYGTAIYIPANTFEPLADENKITIVLNEIYKKSDMVLTNFTTSSNGRTLESGGMVNISAVDGGKEYSKPLKHDISFFFPTLGMRGDMDLFFGEADVNANVDWALSRQKISDYEGYAENDYSGNYFDNLGLSKRRRIVNPESNIICINQAMLGMIGSNPQALCGEGSCPVFWCGLQRVFAPEAHQAKMAAKTAACLESFLSDNQLKNNMAEGDLAELVGELERRYGNNPEKMRAAIERKKVEIFEKAFDEDKMSMEAMNFYIFSTRRMGSINCDAFQNEGNPTEVLTFNLPQEELILDTKLVFKQRNSVLNASAIKGGKVQFRDIPQGLDVCLVAIDYSSSKPRLAIQELTVGKDKPQAIVFQEYESAEALKIALQKLDS